MADSRKRGGRHSNVAAPVLAPSVSSPALPGVTQHVGASPGTRPRNAITPPSTERRSRKPEETAAYSSQECSACGYVEARNRDGERFRCLWCERRIHADVNAARIIGRRRSPCLGDRKS